MKTDNTKLNTETAMSFLCKRNPFDIPHNDWVFMLMDYQDNKGDEALQALAGFYIYTIHNKKGSEINKAIVSAFAHDINGRKDKWCEPRTLPYLKFWHKELSTHYN